MLYVSSQQYETLWHGTSEPADVIKLYGLTEVPVYLTDNPDAAIQYALSDQERTGNDHITLVEVNVNQLDQSKLLPDPDHEQWDDNGNPIETWQQGLQFTDQCIYNDVIPTNALRVEEVD